MCAQVRDYCGFSILASWDLLPSNGPPGPLARWLWQTPPLRSTVLLVSRYVPSHPCCEPRVLPCLTDLGFAEGMEVDVTSSPSKQRLECACVGGLASGTPVLPPEKSIPH